MLNAYKMPVHQLPSCPFLCFQPLSTMNPSTFLDFKPSNMPFEGPGLADLGLPFLLKLLRAQFPVSKRLSSPSVATLRCR